VRRSAWYAALLAILAAVTLATPGFAQATNGWQEVQNGWGEIQTTPSSVPAPSLPDAGKVPAVNAGGTAYELITVAGTGTVTSVTLTVPSIFAVTGSPITTTGTFGVTLSTQAANLVWAGPATGADAAPTFRALVAADFGSFALSPSLRLLTLQDATGDTTPLTVRASSGAGTAPIAQFQASDNTGLSTIAHDGSWTGPVVGNVTGNVSGSSGSTTGNAATASDGLTSASGTAPLTLTLAAKGLTGSVAVATGDAGAGGTAGLVPAPAAGDATKFLRGDMTYAAGAGGGITNSAGANVVTKSDGTNVVASSITDDATLVTINTATKARAAILTDGTGPALGVTATLPASPSATVAASQTTTTSAGNAAIVQRGVSSTLAAGYTGAKDTVAVYGENLVASTAYSLTDYVAGAAIGLYGKATADSYSSIGVKGENTGTGGGASLGVWGVTKHVLHAQAICVGVLGQAAENANSAGVVAYLGASNYHGGVKAAMVASNGAVASPIFVGQDGSTTVFSINDGGGVTLMREVEANTAGSGAPNALAATESNSVMTNEGSTAANYHTLPTAAKGLTYTFVVQDADGLRVTANTGDTIRVIDKVTAAAGYISSTTIGSVVTLVAVNDVEWYAVSIHGTWTDGTFTYDDTSLTTP
jgi:hypothetical protein